MTRKESHALTRERLIETAKRLFLSDGYNVTSLDKVAAEAGFSKGAVYSNFATKHELGLAVIDVVHVERAQSLSEAVMGHDDMDARIEAFARWADENIGDVGWTALEVEFATSTRHLPEVRTELAARRRSMTALLGSLVQVQADEMGFELPIPAEDAALQLLSLGIGLGVQRAIDPEMPVSALVDMLRGLVDAVRAG
ncbi:TetR family transcriptional regulator [Nocardia neocaledoniensis]|uniref:TetR family transcriptional regulator n=2 Tax=Nocardia neocaledoniensis TaxID=236511 RepID=A0A317NC48_9NOCA|nr:TetR/AcrR family transcriptional regulator [Nocardia neocaledoniensis]PWV72821.1 TetR family transcriptional regulator [Nocardia neocaledoniensis]